MFIIVELSMQTHDELNHVNCLNIMGRRLQ